jgi:hypothetical protein
MSLEAGRHDKTGENSTPTNGEDSTPAHSFERRLCEEVKLHLGYCWFCRLELEDKVPDHSTFSVNRHGRFRDSDIFRQVFEAVVRACMDAGLVEGEGFAVDASVIEADASRYHGKAPGEIDWSAPERQTRAVAEFLTALRL